MKTYFSEINRKLTWFGWAFIATLLVGVFLRTYNLHDWLEFRGDQVRDAELVDRVISGESSWPLMGPFMSHSGPTEALSFHMGPIYYYFQILSAEMFGNHPDRLAYFDVISSILSIPLLYVFSRRYFDKNISLGLTALYAVSPYIIHYSRYAWSCNSIPFFVLLLLVSLHKVLDKNEQTPWRWIVALGIALGIGFQLHAITMILFSSLAFFVFIFSMRENVRMWKKWAVVLLIFFFLNIGQIISETRTNFANSKAFLNFFSQSAPVIDSKGNAVVPPNILTRMKNDAECHIEANFLYISSYGTSFDRSNCSYNLSKTFSNGIVKSFSKKNMANEVDEIMVVIGFIFSALGYVLFVCRSRKETDTHKKRFLCLIAVYMIMAYFIMLPLSNGTISDLRYFSFVFFVPFLFVGFFMQFLLKKFDRTYGILSAVAVFLLFFFFNMSALSSQAATLLNGEATCSGSATVGEIEPIADYMIARSNGLKKVYLKGDRFSSGAFEPLTYLMKKQGVDLVKVDRETADTPEFFMSCGELKIKKTGYEYQKLKYLYISTKKAY